MSSRLVKPAARVTDTFAPYERVCEIGSRPTPQFAVRHVLAPGPPKLLIAECFRGAANPNDPAAVAFMGEARRLATLASPHVVRVRELVVRGDDLVVCGEFIDGAKLVDLWQSERMPLGVALRLIVDVLSGAGAIHALRAADQTPMRLAHGELSPSTVVVGTDGVGRVLHAIARRAPGARPEDASIGYLAPEVLAAGAYDARADVFSVGVFLWEAIEKKPLFGRERTRDARAQPIPPAVVPESVSWASGLVTVAAKALALSPDDRWPTVAALSTEIRKVAGLRLASATAAAAFAKDLLSASVKARREHLETAAVLPPISSVPAQVSLQVREPVSVLAESIEEAPDPDPVALLASTPPPLPARARAAPPPTGLPHRRVLVPAPGDPLAIDVHVSLGPPPNVATRRRRAVVLGGVCALGVVIFGLAGWRVAHRPLEDATRGPGQLGAARASGDRPTGPSAIAPNVPPAAVLPMSQDVSAPTIPPPSRDRADPMSSASAPSSIAWPSPVPVSPVRISPPVPVPTSGRRAVSSKLVTPKGFDPNSL